MMILKKVLYEFFDTDEISAEVRLLHRQIIFESNTGQRIYISWTWERQYGVDSPCYSVGYRENSYFTDSSSKTLDVSNTAIWRPFVGCLVNLCFLDDDHQVLLVNAGSASIYCYTFEEDVIRIGVSDPTSYDRSNAPSLTPTFCQVEVYVEEAVQWALERLGSTEYAFICYGFLEDAYEFGNDIVLDGQGCTAKEAADAYGPRRDPEVPPRGAYVFYDCWGIIDGDSRNWGHIGLSLGDGQVVHAWDKVRVDGYRDIEALEAAPGWTKPSYIGWVPASEILQGMTINRENACAGSQSCV